MQRAHLLCLTHAAAGTAPRRPRRTLLAGRAGRLAVLSVTLPLRLIVVALPVIGAAAAPNPVPFIDQPLRAPARSLPLLIRGEYHSACQQVARDLEGQIDDGWIHLDLYTCYQAKGMHREEMEELGRAAAAYGFPEVAPRLRRAFEASGYRGALRQWAREIEHLRATRRVLLPGVLARTFAILGDWDRVFYWVEESLKVADEWDGIRDDSPPTVLMKWKSLRNDPRYVDLLHRIELAH